MRNRILFYAVMVSVSLFPLLPQATMAAEKYPAHEIQLVIPNPAGGFIDIAVRMMSDNLSKILGVPIIINNRTGAGGASGTTFLAKAKPDGYTMGAAPSADVVLIPAILPSVPYKPTDLDPLCKFILSPSAVYSKADAPWKTIEDLVADAKKRPGKLTYGATTQSISYFQMEGFMAAAGFNMLHIPLQGVGQTTTRILGGNLDIGISSVAPLVGQFKAGTIRPLMLISPERMPEFSQIPTMKEKGFENPLDLYAGFFLPLGTPKPIKDVLEKALEKAIKDPSLKSKLEGVFLELDYVPAAFSKEIQDDYKRVTSFLKAAAAKK